MNRSLSHLRAIAYGLAGYTLWVLSDGFLKLAGQARIPIWQIMEFTSLASMVTIFLAVAAQGRVSFLRPNRVKGEIFRTLTFVLLAIANVIAFTNLPMTFVYTSVFLAPLLIAVFAARFMGEPLSWRHGFAIAVGFGGVVLALDPTHINLSDGKLIGYIALPFLLIFCVANMLMLRRISRTESSESMAFFPQAGRALFALPFCLWHFEPMTVLQSCEIASIGIIGGLGWLLVAAAFKHAPAATIAPTHYSQIITGAILGYFVWHDKPMWNLIVGASIIIASGLFIAHHVHRRQPLTP